MAESTSPKGSSGDFAKKVQRQLSRSKEKVKINKSKEWQSCKPLIDLQIDGNRMYKDLRNYINAVREMREASTRLFQSLFDVYETDWAAGEDLGAIVEGENLLWNDYEAKLLDQGVRTMESYVNQFPDVREKIAKRGRKLIDYDSSRHHLEALQTAKKKDDIKINKAEEEMNYAKHVYEYINSELKEELPVLYDSRIGCYVAVFSALSSLRGIFYKEMNTLNRDLQNVLHELQAQHPDKAFVVRGMQRYGSLKRRSLMSPKAWKTSFSEFHKNYNPKDGQKFSFRSPDKPFRSTLSRESSSLSPTSESGDQDAESSHSEICSSPAQEESAVEMAGNELKAGEDNNQVNEEKSIKEEKPETKPSAESDNKANGEKAPLSESSSEPNNSCDSESLELQLCAAENSLHIEEREDSPVMLDTVKPNGLENGDISGFNSEPKDLSISHKVSNLIRTQLMLGAAGLCYEYAIVLCHDSPVFFLSLCPV
uniref:BAR domain-containing protein n=1 Tax=Monopterus albus TaxID=43700 RepID=A0A3Q3JNL6_MONAL